MSWGALISGGLSLAGSLGSAWMQSQGQQAANETNLAIAAANRAFQEESYRHRYQWQVEDLRKAGLNPILAARQGAGPALPGSVIPVQNVYGGIDLGVGDAVNSGVSAFKAETERKKTDVEVEKIGQEVGKVVAEIANIRAATNLSVQQRENAEAELKRIFADTVIKNGQGVLASEQIKLVQSEVAINKWIAELEKARARLAQTELPRAIADEEIYNTAFGEVLKWIDRVRSSVFGGGRPRF